jgi:3-oxoacyl-[acyl-carrier protein] reductase
MQTLSGRTCVFAGATGGDGVDTVRELCKGGMNVIMMTHNEAHAIALKKEIEEAGYPGKCDYLTGDGEILPNGRNSLYQSIVDKYGSVDVVISNTGADGELKAIEDVTGDDLMKSITHLTKGSFNMLKTALPFLKESKAPRVIFMTTVEGITGGTYESFTNAVAKGAVASLTVNCASRLAQYGITVNAVAKGAIPRIDPPHEGAPNPADRLPIIPLGRLGTPVDLAQAICFIASEESSYITGELLNVSGGLRMA